MIAGTSETGSIISLRFSLKWLHRTRWGLGSVSRIRITNNTDINAVNELATNMVFKENSLAIQLPIGGVIDDPILILTPMIPIASPRLEIGAISATYADIAVGVKPVEKPCINLNIKNMDTADNNGYKQLQMIQTIAPTAITGILPI